MRARTAALRKDNTRLAEQLVAVRSGSALLEQLRRVTPGGVQLQSVRVQGDAIQISGEVAAAMAPGPLERINALVLALAALPMSAADGVEVVKITRPDADKERPAALTFSLRWTLDPAARPSLAELEALGADGLAARYRLLQQAGVAL
jgi:type IV pilus assembly protein PilN